MTYSTSQKTDVVNFAADTHILIFFFALGKVSGSHCIPACILEKEMARLCPIAPYYGAVDLGQMVDKSSSSSSRHFIVKLTMLLQLKQYYKYIN